MNNNINSFYVCDDYRLLIYETKENASIARASSPSSHTWHIVAGWHLDLTEKSADFWSKELNSKVTYSNPGEPIFLVKKEDDFWNVIIGERIGWIIAVDWINTQKLELTT